MRIQKKILIFLVFHIFAAGVFAGEAAHIEAGRMRSGIHKGVKAREFSGSVVLDGKEYVLRCDALVLYEDGFWEAAGSIVIVLPGVRIDAQSGYFRHEGFAVFSGSAYIFSNSLKIDFNRLSFTDPRRLVLEDAVFSLDEWENERSFAVLALIFDDMSLHLELPKDRISLTNANMPIIAAIQKGISDGGNEK